MCVTQVRMADSLLSYMPAFRVRRDAGPTLQEESRLHHGRHHGRRGIEVNVVVAIDEEQRRHEEGERGEMPTSMVLEVDEMSLPSVLLARAAMALVQPVRYGQVRERERDRYGDAVYVDVQIRSISCAVGSGHNTRAYLDDAWMVVDVAVDDRDRTSRMQAM